jgi:hypothetical protein
MYIFRALKEFEDIGIWVRRKEAVHYAVVIGRLFTLPWQKLGIHTL